MWTRSARNKITGKFTVVCTDYSGNVFFTGEFADMHEADRAGESAERRMTQREWSAVAAEPLPLDDITDDELLREILA